MSKTRKLILKLLAPNAFSARPVAHGIARLNHKLANDAVEDDVIVIPVACMRDKVLDRPRRRVRE